MSYKRQKKTWKAGYWLKYRPVVRNRRATIKAEKVENFIKKRKRTGKCFFFKTVWIEKGWYEVSYLDLGPWL